MRTEAHLVYEAGCSSPLAAKFAWKSGGETRSASHVYETAPANGRSQEGKSAVSVAMAELSVLSLFAARFRQSSWPAHERKSQRPTHDLRPLGRQFYFGGRHPSGGYAQPRRKRTFVFDNHRAAG